MTGWPDGVGRAVFDELDSTNAEAQRRALAEEPGPLWILAGRQLQGRGRRGRPWSTERGNFSATLLLRPPGGPTDHALRSFVTALALYDALVEITGRPELFSLKWPNDVLLNGQKLAGILLESGSVGGAPYLSIGIGINLRHVPPPEVLEPGATPPVALSEATGISVTPEEMLDYLAAAFARREAQFATYGFGSIRTAWLAHAARLGEVVTARMPGREVTGTFVTLDDHGAIVLQTAQGRVAVPAADIHFGTGV